MIFHESSAAVVIGALRVNQSKMRSQEDKKHVY